MMTPGSHNVRAPDLNKSLSVALGTGGCPGPVEWASIRVLPLLCPVPQGSRTALTPPQAAFPSLPCLTATWVWSMEGAAMRLEDQGKAKPGDFFPLPLCLGDTSVFCPARETCWGSSFCL